MFGVFLKSPHFFPGTYDFCNRCSIGNITITLIQLQLDKYTKQLVLLQA